MDGFQNEYNFVLEFNNKKVDELNPIAQDLVYSIFNNINGNNIIKCWKNHYDQKSDIFIKIGNAIKGISIKMGNKNSVHVESIKDFKEFLKEHNIPDSIIDEYLRYHYADGTTNNNGRERISADDYKKDNQKKIDIINKYFNNEKILLDAINRFVIKGNNSIYPIDAIIYGTPDNYLWLSRNDIVTFLLNKKVYFSSPHFGELVCQPMGRCLNYNEKYETARNFVQIKWYRIFDNII